MDPFNAFWETVLPPATPLNTQYMTNSFLIYPVKMEYVSKLNIFGLKMMVTSGLEKLILKFLHAQAIFLELILHHRKEHFYTKLQIQ